MKRWSVLHRLINRHNYKRVVELGVWKGATMAYLLKYNPYLEYYGVDLFEPQPDGECETYISGENGHDWDHDLYLDHAVNLAVAHGNAEVLIEDTKEAHRNFEDGSLDLVFIDADHSYAGVKADILNWLPKVRVGGMICGHDYSDEFSGVVMAVDELLGRVEKYDDTVWAFRVP